MNHRAEFERTTRTIKKKICLLGAFGVGKTSLSRSFVYSIFDPAYRTTVGVTIDKCVVQNGSGPVELVIWDVEGVGPRRQYNPAYLRGASGYLLVIDGTRHATLQAARQIQENYATFLADLPCVAVLNKRDLTDKLVLSTQDVVAELHNCQSIVASSALDGSGVPDAFSELTRAMVSSNVHRAV